MIKFMKRNKQKKRILNINKKKKIEVLIKIKMTIKMTIFEKVLRTICILNNKTHCAIAMFAVGLGFIFNYFDEMPLFWLKALFGFFLYSILSYSIKYIEKKKKDIAMELTGDPKLVKCQISYTTKTKSNYNFILCIIACIYFPSISIILGFVKINLIGIYSLIGLVCVVFNAFIVFQQYICILLLLYDISKISPGNFYELLPERTGWFNFLESFSNIYRNIFIVLGSLFTMLFIVFSPINSIEIIFYEKFTSNQYIPLLCTWIIILVAIFFMIPYSSFVRHRLLRKIYNNLTAQSIANYNHLFNSSTDDNKAIYMDVIFRINDRKYKLQNSYAWVIPVIVSIANFSSVIISTIVDLKEIGILT